VERPRKEREREREIGKVFRGFSRCLVPVLGGAQIMACLPSIFGTAALWDLLVP